MSQQQLSFYQKKLTSILITSTEQKRFLTWLKKDKITREENPLSHTCVMIVPFNPQTKEVLLIHHKKAKSWLFPGGHVDVAELPLQTAIREAEEELGLKITEKELLGPFGAQVLDMENPAQICREHFDLFYALPIDPAKITVDMREFHEYEWVPFKKARARIGLEYYKESFDKFLRFMKWE